MVMVAGTKVLGSCPMEEAGVTIASPLWAPHLQNEDDNQDHRVFLGRFNKTTQGITYQCALHTAIPSKYNFLLSVDHVCVWGWV